MYSAYQCGGGWKARAAVKAKTERRAGQFFVQPMEEWQTADSLHQWLRGIDRRRTHKQLRRLSCSCRERMTQWKRRRREREKEEKERKGEVG